MDKTIVDEIEEQEGEWDHYYSIHRNNNLSEKQAAELATEDCKPPLENGE